MDKFDRRSALKLGLLAGAVIAAPTAAGAQGEYGLTIDALPRAAAGTAATGAPGEDTPALPNPVLFWNGVSLDLNALDHTLPAADARAPGPCASAWALGLVHAAIADAVHYA